MDWRQSAVLVRVCDPEERRPSAARSKGRCYEYAHTAHFPPRDHESNAGTMNSGATSRVFRTRVWETRSMTIRLCLTGNEPRQSYLFEELAHRATVVGVVPFDDVDLLTKYVAAGLSISWPRSEWWYNYHMHPLLQRRHRKVLLRGLRRHLDAMDALVMWGSWFHPFRSNTVSVPFFPYVDQSHTLTSLPGEPRGRFGRRKRAHALQQECYVAAGAVFCMSEWARQQTLASYDLRSDKVLSVGWGPCAVDLSAETLSDRDQERPPIVLHVSNNFYRKGLDYLVETAERVCAVIPDTRFIVVGRDMSGFAVPTTRRVEFLGRIREKARLQELFRAASLFFFRTVSTDRRMCLSKP